MIRNARPISSRKLNCRNWQISAWPCPLQGGLSKALHPSRPPIVPVRAAPALCPASARAPFEPNGNGGPGKVGKDCPCRALSHGRPHTGSASPYRLQVAGSRWAGVLKKTTHIVPMPSRLILPGPPCVRLPAACKRKTNHLVVMAVNDLQAGRSPNWAAGPNSFLQPQSVCLPMPTSLAQSPGGRPLEPRLCRGSRRGSGL
jgi:hypothetical protein